MRRAIAPVMAALVLATAAPAVFACPLPHRNVSARAPASKPAIRCPVSGAVVNDPAKAPKSVYKGKTYYFCCEMCKQTFDKNPAKYAGKNAKK